jgi:hypothetical protein
MGAHDVFAHRPHLVALVRVFDQDVDLGEADLYRNADSTGAVGDGELATLLGGGGRLQDANGFDAGSERGVGQFAGLDFARVIGVRFEHSGIDASQFHFHSPGFVSIEGCPRRQNPEKRGRSGRGKGGALAPGFGPLERQRRDEPALCGGRAPVLQSLSCRPPYSTGSFWTARPSD